AAAGEVFGADGGGGGGDRHTGRGGVFLGDLGVDLVAMHSDRARGLDTDAHLVAAGLDDRDHDVVADHDALAGLTGEDQHVISSPVALLDSASGAWIGNAGSSRISWRPVRRAVSITIGASRLAVI